MDKKLQKLKQTYENVPIPVELDEVVERALTRNQKKRLKPQRLFAVVAAAVAISFTITLNTSTTFAKNMAQIPMLSAIVEVLTFATIEDHNGNHQANIEIPQITGDSKEIAALNAKYAEEGREIYEQYLAFSAELDEEGHYGVDSGYLTLTDNDQILSIGRYVVEMVGSSSTVMTYTTIDKEQQIAITLPSLFKDDSYIESISVYIVEEMRRQMKASNGDLVYWVVSEENDNPLENFVSIKNEQNFYISEENKLVIAFDKYEVAPGYMGTVEFEIPTELIEDVLVSNRYIK